MTLSGRKPPSFTGVSGLVIALKMVRIPPINPVRVQLIGPLACGPDPVKSAMNSVSLIVTFTLIGMGSSLRPSSSMKSSA